tara:strand:- start:1228 stop:1353 length:126 start_codon:yes stop_codon:yes gene_type:complete
MSFLKNKWTWIGVAVVIVIFYIAMGDTPISLPFGGETTPAE